MKNADLAQLPADFGTINYRSTQQDNYRNPYPSVTTPVSSFHIEYLFMDCFNNCKLTKNHKDCKLTLCMQSSYIVWI